MTDRTAEIKTQLEALIDKAVSERTRELRSDINMWRSHVEAVNRDRSRIRRELSRVGAERDNWKAESERLGIEFRNQRAEIERLRAESVDFTKRHDEMWERTAGLVKENKRLVNVANLNANKNFKAQRALDHVQTDRDTWLRERDQLRAELAAMKERVEGAAKDAATAIADEFFTPDGKLLAQVVATRLGAAEYMAHVIKGELTAPQPEAEKNCRDCGSHRCNRYGKNCPVPPTCYLRTPKPAEPPRDDDGRPIPFAEPGDAPPTAPGKTLEDRIESLEEFQGHDRVDITSMLERVDALEDPDNLVDIWRDTVRRRLDALEATSTDDIYALLQDRLEAVERRVSKIEHDHND